MFHFISISIVILTALHYKPQKRTKRYHTDLAPEHPRFTHSRTLYILVVHFRLQAFFPLSLASRFFTSTPMYRSIKTSVKAHCQYSPNRVLFFSTLVCLRKQQVSSSPLISAPLRSRSLSCAPRSGLDASLTHLHAGLLSDFACFARSPACNQRQVMGLLSASTPHSFYTP